MAMRSRSSIFIRGDPWEPIRIMDPNVIQPKMT
jgi:hypothetical protein